MKTKFHNFLTGVPSSSLTNISDIKDLVVELVAQKNIWTQITYAFACIANSELRVKEYIAMYADSKLHVAIGQAIINHMLELITPRGKSEKTLSRAARLLNNVKSYENTIRNFNADQNGRVTFMSSEDENWSNFGLKFSASPELIPVIAEQFGSTIVSCFEALGHLDMQVYTAILTKHPSISRDFRSFNEFVKEVMDAYRTVDTATN